MGAGSWHPPHPDPTVAPDPERPHREPHWQVPRRALERVLVPHIASGQDDHGSVQSSQATILQFETAGVQWSRSMGQGNEHQRRSTN